MKISAVEAQKMFLHVHLYTTCTETCVHTGPNMYSLYTIIILCTTGMFYSVIKLFRHLWQHYLTLPMTINTTRSSACRCCTTSVICEKWTEKDIAHNSQKKYYCIKKVPSFLYSLNFLASKKKCKCCIAIGRIFLMITDGRST